MVQFADGALPVLFISSHLNLNIILFQVSPPLSITTSPKMARSARYGTLKLEVEGTPEVHSRKSVETR